MFSFTISLIAILLAAILLSVSLYYFNASSEHAEKDITAAALISQGEQILAAIDVRALDNAHDMSHVDFLTDGKYLSSLPTPPTDTYEQGIEKPSPKDWRVLVAAHKPPIVLSEKLDLETCLLVNDKAGLKGIKSTADPTRRIQCFGTEAPFTMLLNPTAKQWETCETNPFLPGCTEEPPYCEANPFAPECIVCEEYPSHPLCKKTDPCKLDPTLPECNPCVKNPSLPECQPCKLNPNLPECDRCLIDPTLPQCQPCAIDPTLPECQPCKLDPTLPECNPCVTNPSLPECQPCVINPTLPECEPPTCKTHPFMPGCPKFCELYPEHPFCKETPFCELYPDDPICKPDFCELYPEHPFCKETPFCEMFPTHPLCVACPGGDCGPRPICDVVETAPCDLTATGSCVEGAYKYTLVYGTIYRCDDKPKECKITSTLLSPGSGYWLRYHIYRFAAQAGSAGGSVAGYVTKHASWEDAYRPAPSSGEWVKHVVIDPVYEVTNSCTGKCTLVDLELPVPPELGTAICAEWGGSGTCAKVAAEWEAYQAAMAVYQSKLAEFRANKSRYTLIGGKYYDCGGGGGPICSPEVVAEAVYENPGLTSIPEVSAWLKSTGCDEGRGIEWDAFTNTWISYCSYVNEQGDYESYSNTLASSADFYQELHNSGNWDPSILLKMPAQICEPPAVPACTPAIVVEAISNYPHLAEIPAVAAWLAQIGVSWDEDEGAWHSSKSFWYLGEMSPEYIYSSKLLQGLLMSEAIQPAELLSSMPADVCGARPIATKNFCTPAQVARVIWYSQDNRPDSHYALSQSPSSIEVLSSTNPNVWVDDFVDAVIVNGALSKLVLDDLPDSACEPFW